jgi:hypothetical protein
MKEMEEHAVGYCGVSITPYTGEELEMKMKGLIGLLYLDLFVDIDVISPNVD